MYCNGIIISVDRSSDSALSERTSVTDPSVQRRGYARRVGISSIIAGLESSVQPLRISHLRTVRVVEMINIRIDARSFRGREGGVGEPSGDGENGELPGSLEANFVIVCESKTVSVPHPRGYIKGFITSVPGGCILYAITARLYRG